MAEAKKKGAYKRTWVPEGYSVALKKDRAAAGRQHMRTVTPKAYNTALKKDRAASTRGMKKK
jgi:hypothetical protein